jgi:hypothetical protein
MGLFQQDVYDGKLAVTVELTDCQRFAVASDAEGRKRRFTLSQPSPIKRKRKAK